MSENNLNLIIGIAEIILFLTLTFLAVYLISFLKKFLNSISKIENEIVEISDQMSPVISDMKYITDDVKLIVDRSRVQFNKVEDITDEIADKGKDLLNAINKVETFSAGFINNSLNMISAVFLGVKTFKDKITNNHNSEIVKSNYS